MHPYWQTHAASHFLAACTGARPWPAEQQGNAQWVDLMGLGGGLHVSSSGLQPARAEFKI